MRSFDIDFGDEEALIITGFTKEMAESLMKVCIIHLLEAEDVGFIGNEFSMDQWVAVIAVHVGRWTVREEELAVALFSTVQVG